MLEMLKPVAPMNMSSDAHQSMLSVFTGSSILYLQPMKQNLQARLNK